MPLCEYPCGDCHGVSTLLAGSWTGGAGPACERRGGPNVTRLVSGFAFHRSSGSSHNWVPCGERLTGVGADGASSQDRLMDRAKEEMDGRVAPGFERMRREPSAGR